MRVREGPSCVFNDPSHPRKHLSLTQWYFVPIFLLNKKVNIENLKYEYEYHG